jgi:membrane protein implicated in regulation of membrane protease activity
MENVFLGCFAFGALFTVASVVIGQAGSMGHGHGGLHFGHAGHGAPAGHSGSGHAHAAAHPVHQDGDPVHPHGGLPLFNVSSLLAFLTWFGAAGYLLSRFAGWPLLAVVPAAVVAGIAGWLLIALFLAGVLAGEREMDPREYRLAGTLARVTARIPSDGAGEIIFTKAGARRSEAARSVNGLPIPRGTEVLIVDYARGIASVQPWEEIVAGSRTEALEQGVPPASGA